MLAKEQKNRDMARTASSFGKFFWKILENSDQPEKKKIAMKENSND